MEYSTDGVNCTDLEQLARDGQLTAHRQEAAVAAHLRDCEGCQTLYAEGSKLAELLCEPPLLDLEAQRSEIAEALRAEDASWVGRLRALPSSRRYALLYGCGVSFVLLTWALRPRVDLDSYPATRMLLVLSTFLVVAAFAVRQVLRPLSEQPARTSTWLLLLIGLVAPLILALLPEAPQLHATNHGREPVWLGALPCLGIGLAIAAPVAWFWSRLSRGGDDSVHLWLLVAAMGALFGNAVLQLHCPVTRAGHLVLGHASVGFALGAAALTLWRGGRLRRD